MVNINISKCILKSLACNHKNLQSPKFHFYKLFQCHSLPNLPTLNVQLCQKKVEDYQNGLPVFPRKLQCLNQSLFHISQISEERIEKVKDHLKEGEEVSARVIKIDKDERRIGLSIKAADYDEDALAKEVAAYDEVGEDLTTSLGDLLDEATSSSDEENQ